MTANYVNGMIWLFGLTCVLGSLCQVCQGKTDTIALFSCQVDSCWIHILGDDILLDLGYPYYQRQIRAPFNYRRYFNDDEEDDSMGWNVNKRAPGSEFLGKRVPGSEFLGKRAPGSEFLGKRVPGSEFLGKRAPGSEFLGKRAPGSEFLGKRAPGSEFLGKRAPGSEFLGKRAPGSEFLGKRAPGSEFLGKRVPGSEFLGKRRQDQAVDDLYGVMMDLTANNYNHRIMRKRSSEVPLPSQQSNDRLRYEVIKQPATV